MLCKWIKMNMVKLFFLFIFWFVTNQSLQKRLNLKMTSWEHGFDSSVRSWMISESLKIFQNILKGYWLTKKKWLLWLILYSYIIYMYKNMNYVHNFGVASAIYGDPYWLLSTFINKNEHDKVTFSFCFLISNKLKFTI